MIEFNKDELLILKKFSAGIITKEEFLNTINLDYTYGEFVSYLNSLLMKGKKREFSSAFYCLSEFFSIMDNINMHRVFLLSANHNEHEEIVGAFQTLFNDNKENISVLLKAIESIPEYLQPEDFKYPYIRKIIYAIGAQPEPYNIQALEKLTQSEDENIKEIALHQIDKRKNLGRWESNVK